MSLKYTKKDHGYVGLLKVMANSPKITLSVSVMDLLYLVNPMKSLLICLMLTGVCSNISNAQLIDSVYPEMNKRNWTPWKTIHSLHPLDDTSFIVVHSSGRVFGMNIDGKKLWESGTTYSEFGSSMITNAYLTADSKKLVVYYNDDDCDTFYGGYSEVIDLATKENVVVPYKYPKSGRYVFPALSGLPQYLFFKNAWLIFYYNQDSVIREKFNHNILSLDINSKGDYVLMTSDSIFYYKYQQGTFVIYRKANHLIAESKYWIRFSTDSTFILSSGKAVHLFNKDLQRVYKYDITFIHPSFRPAVEWKGPYLTIVESREPSLFSVLDKFLNPVFSSYFPTSHLYNKDVVYVRDSLFIVTGQVYNYENYRTFLKGFDLKEANSVTNISITNLLFKDVTLRGSNNCGMAPLITYDISDATIELTNDGSTSINQITIASEYSICSWYCWPTLLYHDTISDMNLLPGESKIFYLGDIVVEDNHYDQEDGICLYALLPDNHLDVDGSNDYYCFNQPVSTVAIPVKNWLYPSPTSGTINISFSDVVQIVIYDLSGNRIIVDSGINNQQSIDVSGLEAGNYCLVVLTSDGHIVSEKFVKL